MGILQLCWTKSSLHRLTYNSLLNFQTHLSYIIPAQTVRKTMFIVVFQSILWEHGCLQRHYSAMVVYTCLLSYLLPSSRCCFAVCFKSLPSNGPTHYSINSNIQHHFLECNLLTRVQHTGHENGTYLLLIITAYKTCLWAAVSRQIIMNWIPVGKRR